MLVLFLDQWDFRFTFIIFQLLLIFIQFLNLLKQLLNKQKIKYLAITIIIKININNKSSNLFPYLNNFLNIHQYVINL